MLKPTKLPAAGCKFFLKNILAQNSIARNVDWAGLKYDEDGYLNDCLKNVRSLKFEKRRSGLKFG